MNKFWLFAMGIIAAGFAGAAMTMFIAMGLFTMTGLHEFSVLTVLWLIYKSGETYINWEEV